MRGWCMSAKARPPVGAVLEGLRREAILMALHFIGLVVFVDALPGAVSTEDEPS